MHARLEAIAQPRETDSPAVAELRSILRDPELMAGVVDEIADTWDFTPEQLDTLAVLLRRPGPYRKNTRT